MRKELQTFDLVRRGEKPTRAGPCSCGSLYQLCGGRLAVGAEPGLLRKEESRSGQIETNLLGAGWWRSPCSAPAHGKRVACNCSYGAASTSGCTRIDQTDQGRDYQHRQVRWQSTITTGTLTLFDPILGKKRGRISCAKSVLGSGDAMGLFASFGGVSISRRSPGPWPIRVGVSGRSQADGEGRYRCGRRVATGTL